MARHIVLLRGINLGPRNRIAMPALRELLTGEGFGDVRTYVQSGNVVLSSDVSPNEVRDRCERKIAQQFGFDVAVVVRSRDQLAEVVARNPLADVADNPKRYQVSFLSHEPAPAGIEKLASLATPTERLTHIGREIYAWHPDGVARSKLWAALAAGRELGVTATSRNWTTVTTLLAIADER